MRKNELCVLQLPIKLNLQGDLRYICISSNKRGIKTNRKRLTYLAQIIFFYAQISNGRKIKVQNMTNATIKSVSNS